MSVYKRPGDDLYSYDFRYKGRRYSGTTGEASKRKAQAVETEKRDEAERDDIPTTGPLTVGAAFARYWEETGKTLVNADTRLVDLAWIERQLGKNRTLSSIGPDDVARLVAKRRDEKPKAGRKKDDDTPVSAATINRGVIDPLRAVMTRASRFWEEKTKPVAWGQFKAREPQERVRELKVDEEAALFLALRADYHPIVQFALLTGCRREECVGLKWRDIDWGNGQLRVTGKGRKTRTIPLTTGTRQLLWPLPRAHEQVFVFESQRADFAPRGSLHPIRPEGLKEIFERAIVKAQIVDFHFHDLRHTCATRLLRNSNNLRLARDLLGHEDLKTTLKYAHATTEDLRRAMEATEIATKNATETSGEQDKRLADNDE